MESISGRERKAENSEPGSSFSSSRLLPSSFFLPQLSISLPLLQVPRLMLVPSLPRSRHPSAQVLWLLLSVRGSDGLSNLLLASFDSRMQRSFPRLPAHGPSTMVHRLLRPHPRSNRHHHHRSPLVEPRHLSIRKRSHAEAVPTRLGKSRVHHGWIRWVSSFFLPFLSRTFH